MRRDGWLNLLLAELVEPNLGIDRPEFLFDYPASQAALATTSSIRPPIQNRRKLDAQPVGWNSNDGTAN